MQRASVPILVLREIRIVTSDAEAHVMAEDWAEVEIDVLRLREHVAHLEKMTMRRLREAKQHPPAEPRSERA